MEFKVGTFTSLPLEPICCGLYSSLLATRSSVRCFPQTSTLDRQDDRNIYRRGRAQDFGNGRVIIPSRRVQASSHLETAPSLVVRPVSSCRATSNLLLLYVLIEKYGRTAGTSNTVASQAPWQLTRGACHGCVEPFEQRLPAAERAENIATEAPSLRLTRINASRLRVSSAQCRCSG
jgi:hypothetical protein